ncbi:hypothetical protein LIA77_01230 [Sarocladium implicatum]|nr:hypothetical protein LIA77_01230 [Sarocladium implicatum]
MFFTFQVDFRVAGDLQLHLWLEHEGTSPQVHHLEQDQALLHQGMGLPLRMNNLHAPTVPSGPTTAPAANGNAAHKSFAELQRKKEDVEAELKALGSVLGSVSHGVDMETPLLTRDGYPRSDIDVAQSRSRIIHLKNDYKDLMATIEKYLHEHFASLADEDEAAPASASRDEAALLADADLSTLEAPFAKVNTVASGSPADSAGLKAGDEIRSFGYVNRNNHDGLRKVAECVQAGQHIHPGFKGFWSDATSGAAADAGTEEGLGWERHAGVSYSPAVSNDCLTSIMTVDAYIALSLYAGHGGGKDRVEGVRHFRERTPDIID